VAELQKELLFRPTPPPCIYDIDILTRVKQIGPYTAAVWWRLQHVLLASYATGRMPLWRSQGVPMMMRWQPQTDRPTDVFYLLDNRSRTDVQSICIHYGSRAIITPMFIALVTDSFARGASVATVPRCRTLQISAVESKQHHPSTSRLVLITPFVQRSLRLWERVVPIRPGPQ